VQFDKLVPAFWGNLLSASSGYKGALNNGKSSASWMTIMGVTQSQLMSLKEMFFNVDKSVCKRMMGGGRGLKKLIKEKYGKKETE
jgi:hypothetical protein